MSHKQLYSAVFLLAAGLQGGMAHAGEEAAADALFKKGVAEMQAGHYDVACPALAESQKLDPRQGTVFTLADCEAQAGRIATATALYTDYLRAHGRMGEALKLKHAERAKAAQARLEALAPEVPELTLVLPAGAPAGVRVTRDGNELSAASLGMALPVDPGEHLLTTQAPGGPPYEQRVNVGRGEKKTVELHVEAGAVGGEPKAAAGAPVAPQRASVAQALPRTESAGSGRRTAIIVGASVGIAGLAAAGIAGGLALTKKSTIEENCLGTICNATGMAAAEGAQRYALVSTIGVGVGGAGALFTLGMLLFSGKRDPAKPGVHAGMVEVGPAGATFGVQGAF